MPRCWSAPWAAAAVRRRHMRAPAAPRSGSARAELADVVMSWHRRQQTACSNPPTAGGHVVTACGPRTWHRPCEVTSAMTEAVLEPVDQKGGAMRPFNLERHQLVVGEVHRNLPPSSLYEHAIRYEKDASIAENG